MGIFSSIKKAFKKVVKGIGKGIKKVAKGIGKVLGKIAKPFAKMGVLGQIALGFIMPWAVGGIMKGMGFLASEGFGAIASNLAGKTNLFQKAVGKLAQGIHMGASGINKAYTFISDGISAGLNKVSELGGKIKTGITDKFEAAAEWVTGDAKVMTADEAFAKDVFSTDELYSKGSYGTGTGTDFVKEVTAPKNALTRAGDKLITGGSKAFDTAKTTVGAMFTSGELPEGLEMDEEENGPSVSYKIPDFGTTPNTTIENINYQVSSVAPYMGPTDSQLIVQGYQNQPIQDFFYSNEEQQEEPNNLQYVT
tara:strand:- start:2106 stop:3029 length:924 start_codon:yes stop_codon:yes gene_type:complete